MNSLPLLLAQASPSGSAELRGALPRFLEQPEFWIAFGLGSLGIVLGLRTLIWIIRASLAYSERMKMLEVVNAMAKQGKLEPERLERMITELRETSGGRRPKSASATAASSAVDVRDTTFRIGFVLLASSLGFFAAAVFAGENDLVIPGCILGGTGLGLSGMGVARREALQRIRADVERPEEVR
ncbi:MAG: hypothetical protein IPN34_11910 [Planctomycetes bacterium]|nr:hypothetical protein [Planctomycetota bacterium]